MFPKTLIFIFSIFFISNTIIAQSDSIKISINDFSIKSHYYQSDVLKKMEVFKYLKNFNTTKKNIRIVLLNKCLNTGENTKLTEKDSLGDVAMTLKTMGNSVFCIDEIDSDGNIIYHISPSGNLKIKLNEGLIKRN